MKQSGRTLWRAASLCGEQKALWGLANNMTDTLLAAFRKIMQMSDTQTCFIQMAFYGAYFCLALPAALFIRKHSYKSGVILGLCLYAAGAILFCQQRVPLSAQESGCGITQIAITDLKAGEVAETHTHADMQEYKIKSVSFQKPA